MAHVIDASKCSNCGSCESDCPVEAISEGKEARTIDSGKCVDCGTCVSSCPTEAIAPEA